MDLFVFGTIGLRVVKYTTPNRNTGADANESCSLNVRHLVEFLYL